MHPAAWFAVPYPPSTHRERRERVDVGDHVDDRRAVRLQRLLDRRTELRRFLHANAERAHLLGDAREIDLAEGPHFPRLLGLRSAVDAVKAALGLVAARIVVHHRDGIDAPARGSLDLGDVVPEPRIAGERDYQIG